MHLSISLTPAPVFFVLAAVGLLLFVIWMYRFTLPPVSRTVRITLIVLRWTALLLVCLLLFMPVVHIESRIHKQAEIVVLLDNSASMSIPETGGMRGEQVQNLLVSDIFSAFKDRYHLLFRTFSGTTNRSETAVPESLVFQGMGTDIAAAMRSAAAEGQTDAVLLFSDGGVNRGENPVRTAAGLGVPVYTVTVGDPSPKADIVVSSMTANDITYLGNENTVTAVIRGPGYGGRRLSLKLRENGIEVGDALVSLPYDGLSESVRFNYIPKHAGIHSLSAEVETIDGELTGENNRRERLIQVLDRRMKLLLFADAPGPDLAAIRRELEQDEDISLIMRTHKRDGSYYEGGSLSESEFSSLDVMVLLNYPAQWTSPAEWDRLTAGIRKYAVPLLFIGGQHADRTKLLKAGDLLPFQPGPVRPEIAVTPKLSPEGIWHPVCRIEASGETNKTAWEMMSPIFYPSGFKAKPASRILVSGLPERSVPGRERPLVLSAFSGERRSLALIGLGWYRWGFNTRDEERPDLLHGLISNSIRWLAVREPDKPVSLSVNKKVFQAGDPVHVSVQVYDAVNRPVHHAWVQVGVYSPNGPRDFQVPEKGDGIYETVTPLFESGKVILKATARKEGRVLGEDSVEVHISSFNPEYLNSRADPVLMASIAEASGGMSGCADSMASVLNAMDFDEKIQVEKREIPLRHIPVMLVAVILLLASEWFIRKRKGML